MRSALERAEKYLNLAALTSVLLAAVAIALATRRYLQRHLDGCAMMRCLGASQALITGLYVAHFMVLGGLSAVAGIAIGACAQAVLVSWLGQVVAVTLPAPSLLPAVHGAAVGLLLLLGFALPPLMSLAQVPTLRVLRRDLGVPGEPGPDRLRLGVAVIAGMILWRAQELRLGLTVLGWFVAAHGERVRADLGAVARARGLRARGGSWRFGVANLQRRPLGTILQVVALALGIMALLTLTLDPRRSAAHLARRACRRTRPTASSSTSSRTRSQPIAAFLRASAGSAAPELFPMVRGRLVQIGGRSVSADDYTDERARRLITREFNLSWATRMQADNRVVAGRWWESGGCDAPTSSRWSGGSPRRSASGSATCSPSTSPGATVTRHGDEPAQRGLGHAST